MKHNKKRNTAFLYESLVKEMTRAVVRQDHETKDIVASILKEHFGKTSVLHKELNLYKTLCEVREVRKDTAEKVLVEVKRIYHTLAEEEIFDEQTQVIKKINTDLDKSVFSNFVSNYKTLATISQMFSSKTPIPTRVILEQKMVDSMTSAKEESKAMKPIDMLTYNLFVKKFNEKYATSLNENQRKLLNKYLMLNEDNAVEFKIYISEELERLKEQVAKLQTDREVLLDESLAQKNKQILQILEGFKNEKINDGMIKRILKIQALAVEA